MQLVLTESGDVLATHADGQNLAGLYPGGLVLIVADGTAVEVGQTWSVSVAQAQAARIGEAKAACDAVLATVADRFSDYERQTWNAQLAEAKALLADPTLTAASYPTIAGIIAVTGEGVGDFAAAVLKNDEDWTLASAHVIGQRQAAVARIKACDTVAAVLAVSLDIALPA